MRLVSSDQVKSLICDITNLAIEGKLSKAGLQQRLVYEIGKLETTKGVNATDEQMLELLDGDIKFEKEEGKC